MFAAYKGDIDTFVKGASQLDEMTENSRVLIAEACTHVPLSEDIGREKIPNLLRKRFGSGIQVVNVCGNEMCIRDRYGSVAGNSACFHKSDRVAVHVEVAVDVGRLIERL